MIIGRIVAANYSVSAGEIVVLYLLPECLKISFVFSKSLDEIPNVLYQLRLIVDIVFLGTFQGGRFRAFRQQLDSIHHIFFL